MICKLEEEGEEEVAPVIIATLWFRLELGKPNLLSSALLYPRLSYFTSSYNGRKTKQN